ncbi:MAG: DegT/DnrJ/EryC1/StrS family aminotransferase [Anaerolineae bacterium]|nr:DegT/DnrJ/EryC1/StrS family aminotransferase [Anaerolineae bacterium]
MIHDPALVERAEVLREKGTDRSKFFRGLVDKYTWVDVGSSYVLSDLLAAYLLAQLECRERVQQARTRLFARYQEAFAGLAGSGALRLPVVPADCEQAYHMFYMLLSSVEARGALIRHLKTQDILAVFPYVPLHLSPMGWRFGYTEADCPVTQDISGRLVRLPFYNTMTEEEQARVICAVRAFFWAT